MRKVKALVVGGGFGVYGHLAALKMIADVEVIGLVTRFQDQVKKYGYQIPIFESLSAALSQTAPDLISVATTPLQQESLLLLADIQKYSLFLEKPLLVNRSAYEAIQKSAESFGRTCMDFEFFEFPGWHKLKQHLTHQEPGHLNFDWFFLAHAYSVSEGSSWKTQPHLGGGGLSHFGSHMIYNIEHLLGQIHEIQCEMTETQQESHFTIRGTTLRGHTFKATLNSKAENVPHGYSLSFKNSQTEAELKGSNLQRLDYSDLSIDSKSWIFRPELSESLDYRSFYLKSLFEKFLQNQEVPQLKDGLRNQNLIFLCRKSAELHRSLTISDNS